MLPCSLARRVSTPSKNTPSSAPYATEAMLRPSSTTFPPRRDMIASPNSTNPHAIVAKRDNRIKPPSGRPVAPNRRPRAPDDHRLWTAGMSASPDGRYTGGGGQVAGDGEQPQPWAFGFPPAGGMVGEREHLHPGGVVPGRVARCRPAVAVLVANAVSGTASGSPIPAGPWSRNSHNG